MISIEDLFDPTYLNEVKQDLLTECQKFGEVIDLKVPSPLFHFALKDDDPEKVEEKYQGLAKSETGLVSRAHGKIFIKFSDQIAAK